MKITTEGIEKTFKEPEEECKGLVFRARVSGYVQRDKEIVYREELRFLKRKSCPGCELCGYMWEDLDDYVAVCDFPNYEGNLQHGGLYKIEYGAEHRDWETGFVEDVDIDLVRIKEE